MGHGNLPCKREQLGWSVSNCEQECWQHNWKGRHDSDKQNMAFETGIEGVSAGFQSKGTKGEEKVLFAILRLWSPWRACSPLSAKSRPAGEGRGWEGEWRGPE